MVNTFLLYDIIFLIAFTSFVVWFLYTRRSGLKREGPLYLYRTKFGIKAINWFSTKFKKQLNWIQYISIICGYFLMTTMVFLFIQLVYLYIKQPGIVRSVKVPPIMPLIPYLPSIFKIDFLPPFYFTYWILILAVVAIVHEFAHGIFAKLHGIKIKSTGFGFLGPFLAAFVEPDEKQMDKKSIKAQLAVLSAGTFSNMLVFVLFLIIFIGFFSLMFVPAGVIFNTYSFSDINITKITEINGEPITNPSPNIILKRINLSEDLTKIKISNKSYLINNKVFSENYENVKEIVRVYDDLPAVNTGLEGAIISVNNNSIKSFSDLSSEINKYSPGEEIIIKTVNETRGVNEYKLKLAANSEGKPIIGILWLNPGTEGIRGKIYAILYLIREPGVYYDTVYNYDLTYFIYNLIWWMILINVSVALVNMLPVSIFDGGRFFYLTILGITKKEIIAKQLFKLVTILILLLLAIIMVFWVLAFF